MPTELLLLTCKVPAEMSCRPNSHCAVQHRGARSHLNERSAARDRAGERIGIGTVDGEGTIVDHVAGDRAAVGDNPVAKLQRGAVGYAPVLVARAGCDPVGADDVERGEAGILRADVREIEGACTAAAELKRIGTRAKNIALNVKTRPERQNVCPGGELNRRSAAADDSPGIKDAHVRGARNRNTGRARDRAGIGDGAGKRRDVLNKIPVRVALMMPLLTMSPVKLVMPHEQPTTIPVPAVIAPPLLTLPIKVWESATEMPAPVAEIVPLLLLMTLPVKVPISSTAMPAVPPIILPLLTRRLPVKCVTSEAPTMPMKLAEIVPLLVIPPINVAALKTSMP